MGDEIKSFISKYTRMQSNSLSEPYTIQDIEDICTDIFTETSMRFLPEDYPEDLPMDQIGEVDPYYAGVIKNDVQLRKVFDIAVKAYHKSTPESHYGVLNDISRRADDLRNKYIAQVIQSYWMQGRSIFAVYGWAHAVQLEPALAELNQL